MTRRPPHSPIREQNYIIDEINAALFDFDQAPPGSGLTAMPTAFTP